MQGVLTIVNKDLKWELIPPYFEFSLEELQKPTIDALDRFCDKCVADNLKRWQHQDLQTRKRDQSKVSSELESLTIEQLVELERRTGTELAVSTPTKCKILKYHEN